VYRARKISARHRARVMTRARLGRNSGRRMRRSMAKRRRVRSMTRWWARSKLESKRMRMRMARSRSARTRRTSCKRRRVRGARREKMKHHLYKNGMFRIILFFNSLLREAMQSILFPSHHHGISSSTDTAS
jgi:hypothetical protein